MLFCQLLVLPGDVRFRKTKQAPGFLSQRGGVLLVQCVVCSFWDLLPLLVLDEPEVFLGGIHLVVVIALEEPQSLSRS